MTKIGAQKLSKSVTRAAREEGLAVDRLRRWIGAGAFIQSLALAQERSELRFLVKGGHSVELRFPNTARASEDIDIAISDASNIVEAVVQALTHSWGDFTFEVKERDPRPNSMRIRIGVRFNNTDWCTLKVDLVTEELFVTEAVAPIDVAKFGLPPLQPVPCLSRPHQMAQWVHAITKPVTGEPRDRSRNVLDLYLFDTLAKCDDKVLLGAIVETFRLQPTHEFPPTKLGLPTDWIPGLDIIAKELGLGITGQDLADHYKTLIHRILGVPMRQNYEYLFLVLTPVQSVPNPLSGVFNTNDVGYQNFEIQTKQNGYKVASIMLYPGAQRALLVTLERPIEANA